MSLKNPKEAPPKEAIDDIDAFLQPGDPSPSDLRQQQYWQWTFTLGLEELAKDNAQLPGAPVGWQYVIGNRSGQALSATVDASNKLVGLSRGPAVTAALNAARELKTLPEAADSDYEIRLLTIPGLLTEAFWLKSLEGKPDLIVPFSTAQELRLGHPYPIEKFLKIMRPLAKDWQAGWAKVTKCETESKKGQKEKPPVPRQDAAQPPAGQETAQQLAGLRLAAETQLDDGRETQIRTKARQIMAEKRSRKEREKLIAKQRRWVQRLPNGG
jgi:hypothetical protein